MANGRRIIKTVKAIDVAETLTIFKEAIAYYKSL